MGNIIRLREYRGGESSPPAETFIIRLDGTEEKMPGVVEANLEVGEWIKGTDTGGGGYGDPLERDPARVLYDVRERWDTKARASEVYGVILVDPKEGELEVDYIKTKELRERLVSAR